MLKLNSKTSLATSEKDEPSKILNKSSSFSKRMNAFEKLEAELSA